ncbi:hypothetical protein BGX30_007192 [Mortierella sp. GBA39]|nr:hypothetical protein BGX30_007192 [Mortierella sp. GBA39]
MGQVPGGGYEHDPFQIEADEHVTNHAVFNDQSEQKQDERQDGIFEIKAPLSDIQVPQDDYEQQPGPIQPFSEPFREPAEGRTEHAGAVEVCA